MSIMDWIIKIVKAKYNCWLKIQFYIGKMMHCFDSILYIYQHLHHAKTSSFGCLFPEFIWVLFSIVHFQIPGTQDFFFKFWNPRNLIINYRRAAGTSSSLYFLGLITPAMEVNPVRSPLSKYNAHFQLGPLLTLY